MAEVPKLVENVSDYRIAFDEKIPVKIPETSGLRGRILRGRETSPEDFNDLGLPGRELVFIMGPDGLSELPGLPLMSSLGRIGLMHAYIEGRIAQGFSFRLAVFNGASEAPLATWDNALDLVASHHPALVSDIEAQRENLKSIPPQEFARRILPDDFDQIELAGPSHPAFMTTERYLAIPPEVRRTDALPLRRWLIHTEHIGIAFRGDGYTQTPQGEIGLKEYLTANKPIAELQDTAIIDLPLDT